MKNYNTQNHGQKKIDITNKNYKITINILKCQIIKNDLRIHILTLYLKH